MDYSKHNKNGFTTVEVMVSMLLASLLMVAMLSVLRGLKAQADALKTRVPVQSWQQTLDRVLQFDLENSRTYEQTHSAIILRGFAGRGVTGPTWRPASIVYEIVYDKNRSWLVRREMPSNHRELVLADVNALRIGMLVEGENAIPLLGTTDQPEAPITHGLVMEFWGSVTAPDTASGTATASNTVSGDQGGLFYGYRFRQP